MHVNNSTMFAWKFEWIRKRSNSIASLLPWLAMRACVLGRLRGPELCLKSFIYQKPTAGLCISDWPRLCECGKETCFKVKPSLLLLDHFKFSQTLASDSWCVMEKKHFCLSLIYSSFIMIIIQVCPSVHVDVVLCMAVRERLDDTFCCRL